MKDMVRYRCLTCKGEFYVDIKSMRKEKLGDNFYEATCSCPYCKADNAVYAVDTKNNLVKIASSKSHLATDLTIYYDPSICNVEELSEGYLHILDAYNRYIPKKEFTTLEWEDWDGAYQGKGMTISFNNGEHAVIFRPFSESCRGTMTFFSLVPEHLKNSKVMDDCVKWCNCSGFIGFYDQKEFARKD